MPNLQNCSKEDSKPGSLNCESGIVSLSYRTPHNKGGEQYGHVTYLASPASTQDNSFECRACFKMRK